MLSPSWQNSHNPLPLHDGVGDERVTTTTGKLLLNINMPPRLNDTTSSQKSFDVIAKNNGSLQYGKPSCSSFDKKLRFADKIEFHEIPNRKDLSKEEAQASWFTTLDLTRIDSDNEIHVTKGSRARLPGENERPRQVLEPEDESCCLRGLERHFPAAFHKQQDMIKFGRLIVIKYQAKRRREGHMMDHDYLGYAYGRASMKAKESAYSLGLKDQEEASSTNTVSRVSTTNNRKKA